MYKLIVGDVLEKLDEIEDDSIDLIVTSPPYNVNLEYANYCDNRDHKEYIAWLVQIFTALKSKIKVGGRIAVNIGDAKNGRIPSHAELICEMCKDPDFLPFANIIWNKKHTKNRAAWGSYLSPSCPSFPMTFEYIPIFAYKQNKLMTRGVTDITKEEFIAWTNAIWEIKPESRQVHPAQFPIEIPERLIKMLSWKGANVLDPFCGSGTTGIACKLHNRSFIGIDISQEYINLSRERIEKA